ncbi:MAG: beta-galactosidase [Armatimonadota bacterium]|nr:beta-galactosidase [Armatimonadota bacterium]
MFPYGTQYYRPPNPPDTEWEKDLSQIADAGFNIVKVWANWSWIHRDENTFDFDDLDRILDLAEKRNLKIIINTILENAPYWLAKKHPEALYETAMGKKFQLIARSNTPGGAWPGMCWDNAPVRDRAERFLRATGEHYKSHNALWGYDVWNEVFFEPFGHPGFEKEQFCYCQGSKEAFLDWLRRRYGSLEALCGSWRRRYSAWDEVYPPPYKGSYPDWLDWLRFRIERMKEQMQWRVAILRSEDGEHPLTSHGVAWSLDRMPTVLADDWEIAKEVDQWGLSTFPLWQNMDVGDHMRLLDIARSASQSSGKKFWQTELQGGPAVSGLYRSPVPDATDVAFWNWTAFMCGASGLLYWQWRPELLGPESPGFGLCKPDGSPTERTEAASWFALFMNQHPELEESEAVKGDVAILVLPESQLFNYVMEFDSSAYAGDVAGTYRALWEANIQPDFVKIERIDEYPLVYIPFPLLIEKAHCESIRKYVEAGGTVISHACPAHFDDNGYCSFRIPGQGLDEVFGLLEEDVEYVPSLIRAGRKAPEIIWNGSAFGCEVYQEKLTPAKGEVIARFSDGAAAVVDSVYGRGKTRLVGTFPGLAYSTNKAKAAAELIQSGVEYAGVEPALRVSNADVKARLHISQGTVFLWTLNTSDKERTAEITLATRFDEIKSATDLKTGSSIPVGGRIIKVVLGPRMGSVAKLTTV